MLLLTKDNYYEEVKRFIENNDKINLAVAFWGSQATSLFTNSSGKKIRIICNLESGACNPEVIKKLKKQTNIKIKTNKRLHAKVLLSKTSVIIGSANISTNGLTLENSELEGWIEAGILVNDRAIIQITSKWYETTWNSSLDITDNILESAILDWKGRKRIRPYLSDSHSLYEAAKQNLDQFMDRPIYFAIYRNDVISDEASTALEEQQERGELPTSSELYEGWPDLPDDAYLIDIYYGPRSGIRVKCYKTGPKSLITKFKYNNGTEGEIKICFRKTSICDRYKITDDFITAIKDHVAELFDYQQDDDGGSIVPFVEGMKILMK